jgi:uncharacterized protein YkwD
MLRRVAGTFVLLTVALLLATCELGAGHPRETIASTAPTEAVPAARPSPLPIERSPTAVAIALPTGEPTPSGLQPPTPSQVMTSTLDPALVEVPVAGFEAIIVAATNEYRQEHGCSPVAVHPQLTLAAQAHAEDMALNDFFSHVGSGGNTLADRIEAVRYRYRLVGENIAAGFASGIDVVDSWMESEEHRDNILNCEFEEIGVGYIFVDEDPGNETWHYYWVQVFGVEFD